MALLGGVKSIYTAEKRDSKCLGLIFVIFTQGTLGVRIFLKCFFVGCLQVDDLSEGCHVRTKLFSFFFSNKVGLLETHFTSDHPLSVFPAEGAKLSKELRREENADDRSWSFVSPKFKACLRIDFQM